MAKCSGKNVWSGATVSYSVPSRLRQAETVRGFAGCQELTVQCEEGKRKGIE